MSRYAALLLASGITMNQAAAAEVFCSGSLEYIGTHVPDGVFIKISSTHMFKICDLKTQQYRVSPEQCKAILAQALTARAMNATVTAAIDNAPTADCQSLTDWSSADVRWFSINP